MSEETVAVSSQAVEFLASASSGPIPRQEFSGNCWIVNTATTSNSGRSPSEAIDFNANLNDKYLNQTVVNAVMAVGLAFDPICSYSRVSLLPGHLPRGGSLMGDAVPFGVLMADPGANEIFTVIALENYPTPQCQFAGSTHSISRRILNIIDLSYRREFEDLLQIFEFRNKEKIERFLNFNKFLLPLLREAKPKIREWFPSSPLSLEVVEDPEWMGNEQLVLYICSEYNPETAFEKLENFDSHWWIENLKKSNGKLCISLDFV